jgi:hypothetical protein
MFRKFLLAILLACPAFADQRTAAGSQSVVLASDQNAIYVIVGIPTVTPTFTYTNTPNYTPTGSATPTYSFTPTYTFTKTFTPTATLPYGTNTFTPVATRTHTPTYTATTVYTATGSATPTYTSTHTYTATFTPTATNTWTAAQIAANVLYVVGNIAHDGVDSGNPVKVGGKSVTQNSAVSAALDRVDLQMDRWGRLFINACGPPTSQSYVSGTISESTTPVTFAAAAASTYKDLCQFTVCNSGTVGTIVTLKTAATAVGAPVPLAPAGGCYTWKEIYELTANQDWSITSSVSTGATVQYGGVINTHP